mgnify:CR=1 FL=1
MCKFIFFEQCIFCGLLCVLFEPIFSYFSFICVYGFIYIFICLYMFFIYCCRPCIYLCMYVYGCFNMIVYVSIYVYLCLICLRTCVCLRISVYSIRRSMYLMFFIPHVLQRKFRCGLCTLGKNFFSV